MRSITCENLLLDAFTRIRTGQLLLTLPDGSTRFFGSADTDGPSVSIVVKDREWFRRVVLGDDIGLGESFIEGLWETDDLSGFLKLLLLNRHHLGNPAIGLVLPVFKKIAQGADWIRHLLNGNTRKGSVRNIHAHYDLGNQFYQQFLDPGMTYSSAWFSSPHDALEDAQTEKYDRLCRRLDLRPGLNVLEIGSGWGGFAIHAATRYGCNVTSLTVSQEQYAYAKERVAAAGLADQITILFKDYRDMTGRFDRIASIEMLEAVGHEHLNSYFRQCARLLTPDGIVGLQVILTPDSRDHGYRRRSDYIRKHIFPGGHVPTFKSIHEAVARHSNWDLQHMESFGTHYAETLRRWRARFLETTAQRRALGFPETFDRKWLFYFAFCEAGFECRHIQVAQLIYAAPDNAEHLYGDNCLSLESDIPVRNPMKTTG